MCKAFEKEEKERPSPSQGMVSVLRRTRRPYDHLCKSHITFTSKKAFLTLPPCPRERELLYAATAAAAETQKAASQVASQVVLQVHSQVNGSERKILHVSHHTHVTQQSHHTQLMQRTHQSCQNRSQRSQAPGDEDGAAAPIASRPPSPSFALNAANEEMLAEMRVERGAADRPSYARSTSEPETVNSHFHLEVS